MSSQNPPGQRALPPTYFFAAMAAAFLLHALLPVAHIVRFPWSLAGALPIVVGIWLNLAADRALKTHGTTVKPFEESTALIAEGPYKVSRHPMYLGMILIVLGLARLLGTLSPFVVVPVLWILLERCFVHIEEQKTERRFGPDWQRYRKLVRRWL